MTTTSETLEPQYGGRAPAQGPSKNSTVLAMSLACAAGLAIGLAAPQFLRPSSSPVPQETPRTPETQSAYRAVTQPYAAPSKSQVTAALAEARSLFRTGGAVGLVDASANCFRALSREPAYGLLDYCLALDAYAAYFSRTAPEASAPVTAYFAEIAQRRTPVVAALTGDAATGASRLSLTDQLIGEVLAESTGVQAAEALPPETAAEVPLPLAGGPAPSLPDRITPSPRPPVYAEREVAEAPPPIVRPYERNSPFEPRTVPEWTEEARPAQRRRVQPPPQECLSARSFTEQIICSDPALARADRRMEQAFTESLATTRDPRRLRREQQQWLRQRDDLGLDRDALLDHYQARIDELWIPYD